MADHMTDAMPNPRGEERECCRRLEERLRVELEGRIVGLEVRLEEKSIEDRSYMAELKECILLRNEKLVAKEVEIESRDTIIAEMRKEITVLTATVEKLTKIIERNPGGFSNNSRRPDSVRVETKNKKTRKTYTEFDMNVFRPENFNRFFIIDLEPNKRRTLCPYKLEEGIAGEIGGKPKSITSSGENGLLVEVANKEQSTKITELKEICTLTCTVKRHDFFNILKGLIYIKNNEIDDFESFKNGLSEEYNLIDVEEATWIKPKNKEHKAYIISTNQPSLPGYIKIIGEHTITHVYPYHESIMQCKNCQVYGHTAKRCSSTAPICGKCTDPHTTENCTVEPENYLCHNCRGNHRAGHHSCPDKKKEIKLQDIQQQMKIGRSKARQIMEGKSTNYVEETESSRYLEIKISSENVRKICPFKMENFFTQKYGFPRENIRPGRGCFIIKTENNYQTVNISNLKTVLGSSCTVAEHPTYNLSKGIIYVRGFEISDEDSFFEGIKVKLNLKEVIKATWIKPKSSSSVPFLLTFNASKCPSTIKIPGEPHETTVYAYKPRPMFCKNCLDYSHTVKRCENKTRCDKCSLPHSSKDCDTTEYLCHHCEGNHKAGSRECERQKQEEEITAIQHNEKIHWIHAKQIYFNSRPAEAATYAEKVKQTRGKKKPPTEMTIRQETEAVLEVLTSNVIAVTEDDTASEPTKKRVRKEEESEDSDEDGGATAKRGKSGEIPLEPIGNVNMDLIGDSDDGTSETCDKIRKEAEEIYKDGLQDG